MEIRYLTQSEKQKSRTLYQEAFCQDSRAFQDYYYTEKTKDNKILAMLRQGKIVSMLHRNPYLLKAGRGRWKCDYIVAVATAKPWRKQGYMRMLMERALQDMYRERMPFCFLMPVAERLYRPFGFTYVYDKQEWQTVCSLEKVPLSSQNARITAAWMNKCLEKEYELFAFRTVSYLKRLQKEIQSEGGKLEVLMHGQEIAGIESKELLLCNPDFRKKKGEKKPCIMGRIVDLRTFIQEVRLEETADKQELLIQLNLRDRQLQENQGMWFWKLTKRGSWIHKQGNQEAESRGMELLSLDIQELTAWLTGYQTPKAARRYEGVIRPLKGVFLDEVV